MNKRNNTQLSKHLRKCLNYLEEMVPARKKAGYSGWFDEITFYPSIKRARWVYDRLEEAGYLESKIQNRRKVFKLKNETSKTK